MSPAAKGQRLFAGPLNSMHFHDSKRLPSPNRIGGFDFELLTNSGPGVVTSFARAIPRFRIVSVDFAFPKAEQHESRTGSTAKDSSAPSTTI
jgi:hypothetical protein